MIKVNRRRGDAPGEAPAAEGGSDHGGDAAS